MISISDLFEYSEKDVFLSRLDSSFPGLGQSRVPNRMLKKAMNMPFGKKRDALVVGAKNLAKRNPAHRLR